jgi:hypothetical protein
MQDGLTMKYERVAEPPRIRRTANKLSVDVTQDVPAISGVHGDVRAVRAIRELES